MSAATWQDVTRLLLPTSLIIALLASLTAFQILGPVAGIKSGYVFLGLLFAIVIYRYSQPKREEVGRSSHTVQSSELGKVVFGIVLLSMAAVAQADAFLPFGASTMRTVSLLVVLPIGYILLTVQIRRRAPTGWLISQLVALFALDPITKYLSTNFYFGRGDIPKHVYYTDLITANGTWQSLPETTMYQYFPGHQTLLGAVSFLTGFSSYDSLVITGIITYLVVICAAYLLARLFFSDRILAICILFGVTVLGPIHRYSVYFYPQALAVVLGLIVILGAYRYSTFKPTSYLVHTLLTVPIVIALWFTHHFTVVLFAPILAGLLTIPILADRAFGFEGVIRPQLLPIVAWVGGSVAYWSVGSVFISTLISALSRVVSYMQVTSSSSGGDPVQTLGSSLPEPSITEAVISLVSVSGIYNVFLVCMLSLGVVMLFRNLNLYRRTAGIVTIGVLGSIFMIRIPLDIHGIQRIQLPLSLFVAFIIGSSLYRFVSIPSTSLKRIAPAILVVAVLATAGPAVAADDLYGLHSGPDLWEKQSLPETQKEFSAAEMESFQQSAAYIEEQETSVATDWNSAIGLSRYGAASGPFVVADDRISTEQDLLLYRQRWTDHSVRYVPSRIDFRTLLVSEDWMRDSVRSENKVYTTGEIGMLADRENATYLDRQ
ncbi:hypothetical protein NDI54_15240 [Haloarcula sp. S1AR25-5A]|uniref:Uncharacterized protein n=1 Tax=Haloarcula terrestris TaxID=2950533 RepID=A0AAE4F0E6_9EURY|nr:hypothetical protein [Haloarcula terrestris]MDS0222699.1 hypothetical protein [Haloarcula terrestris]